MDLPTLAGAGLGGAIVTLILGLANLVNNARKDRRQDMNQNQDAAYKRLADVLDQVREQSKSDRERLDIVELENEKLRGVARALRAENDALAKQVYECQRQISALTRQQGLDGGNAGPDSSTPPGMA